MDEFNGEPDEAPLNLSQVFSTAIEHYKVQAKFFISVSLVYALLSEAGGFLIAALGVATQEQIFLRAFINIILACWASIAIIYASSCLSRHRPFKIEQALGLARKRYSLYLSVYLAMLCMIIFGFLVFIVPGLYLMTIFLFADILVVVDRVSFVQAFQRSAKMVKPYFWKVFAYLFFIVGISLSPEVIYQLFMKTSPAAAAAIQKVVAVIIMPFLMIAQVELFYNIRNRFKFDLSQLDEMTEPAQSDE